ncbi:hypothetical protein U14_05747 [Candidatus Moduliflexus flocculans]|uniref:BFD-like (2Fe-2S) protein n=1 Tax=Candidatus Moduliflexus flocculans TaxID=1499966 RepID=A0A081BST1_9BACT|nr:hypothetical protein U14_05747 [Candidatus Moduliflexus flocculans]
MMTRDDDMICYCFQYTSGDIRRDAAEHGKSTILQQILDAKRAGGCQCAEKHPKGT